MSPGRNIYLFLQIKHGLPWLVYWLRVPTPMRAIRVRAWVEVVGSVMELFHFRVQWNARNISRATLRECWEASSYQEANPMYEETDDSCLPAHSCQEGNPMYEETNDSLSEGELESTWPCSIQKYCRVQWNHDFIPVQWNMLHMEHFVSYGTWLLLHVELYT